MRARLALKLADTAVEIREISLRDKPAHLLQVSPKGTVPVMMLPDGYVIEESIEIMLFALKTHPLISSIHAACRALVVENDTDFKQALDAYKYPERFPGKTQIQYRTDGEVYLKKLEKLLQQNTCLFDAIPTFADYAIFPFIRQFAAVDSAWFSAAPYSNLRIWLASQIESDLFNSVMEKRAIFSPT